MAYTAGVQEYDATRDQNQQDYLLNYSQQRVNSYKINDYTTYYIASGVAIVLFLVSLAAIKNKTDLV